MKLWVKHGSQPRFARLPEDFDSMVQNGGAVAGSPESIREQVQKMTDQAGAGIFARAMLPAARERVAQAV